MRIYTACLFAFLFIMARKQQETRRFHIGGFAQGTSYNITYFAQDSIIRKSSIDSIFDVIDRSVSLYRANSLINKFNKSKKGTIIDGHFRKIMLKSFEAFDSTGGVFDVTIQPIVEAWGFSAKQNKALPDSMEIARLKECVSSKFLRLQGNRLIKLRPCVKIDLNGIAQGYTVDLIAGFLRDNGVTDYLVEVGGELVVNGRKYPGGEKMRIGIESPGDDPFDIEPVKTILELDSGAITTSGNYRKFFESEGKRISHLIDPRTGFSSMNELISVTVYAPDALTADAYDNALMVMGLAEAMKYVDASGSMAAYFIYKKPDGSVADTATNNFYRLIKKAD